MRWLSGCTFLVALSLLGAPPLQAGAWTREPGGAYHRIALTYYDAARAFNGDGERVALDNQGRYHESSLSYYLEYGCTENISLTASLSGKRARYRDDNIRNQTTGLSDLELGLKRKIYDKAWVLALQVALKIPETYNARRDLPLGTGQYDLEARFLSGHSIRRFPGYFGAEVAYRYREGGAWADEIRYLLEFGTDLSQRLSWRLKLDGTKAINTSDDDAEEANGPARVGGATPSQINLPGGPRPPPAPVRAATGTMPAFDLIKLDLTLSWRLTRKTALELGYAPALRGKQIAAGDSASLALAFSW